MLSRSSIALWAMLLFVPVAFALGDDAATKPAVDHARLVQEVNQLLAKKDYPALVIKCREAIAAEPAVPDHYYNLACALARLGDKDSALVELDRSVTAGFCDVGHMLDDDDLVSLSDDPRFVATLRKARNKERELIHGPYEKGAEIAGVKTVEGNPLNGLRWRLRYPPDLDAQHPCRVVIWMHPSGGSMNAPIEPMATMLASHRLALMVFTQKDFRSWSSEDAQAMAVSLMEAEKRAPGLEINKPILLGFSAGAQMALILWTAHPGAFGALILDAGYPLDAAALAKGKVAVQPLPDDPAIAHTPILAIVGENDAGSQVWKQCEAAWQKAGVPLTVRYVPGRKHEWLLNDPVEKEALEDWVTALTSPPTTKPSEGVPATQP